MDKVVFQVHGSECYFQLYNDMEIIIVYVLSNVYHLNGYIWSTRLYVIQAHKINMYSDVCCKVHALVSHKYLLEGIFNMHW